MNIDEALVAGAMEAAADACTRHVVCNEAITAAVEYALAQQPAAEAQAQGGGEVVYQIENDPEEWFDVDRAMYEGHDGSRKRTLYTAPPSAPMGVAYLDIGAGGYMDLGSELSDEELAKLPYGRHVLGIIGTHGVDGYVLSQQPAAPDCRCIDCGGDQPGHDSTCKWMEELHGEQPAAVDDAKDAARYRWLKENHNADLLAEDVIDEAMSNQCDIKWRGCIP